MKELLYLEAYNGLEVFDKDDSKGVILKCSDIHNIEVGFSGENGEGMGLYCLDKSCVDYEPLFKNDI